MDNNKKIYVGSGKEKFEGSLINVTINLSKITKTSKEHIFEYSGDKYLKLKVVKKKDGMDEYGKSHYVEVDTWKPSSAATAEDKGMSFGEPEGKPTETYDDDIPF